MTGNRPTRPGLPPIVCTPWCTDGDGHTQAVSEGDQVCWGETGPYVFPVHEPAEIDSNGAWLTRVGAMAYRGFGKDAVVYLHVARSSPHADISVYLTANEARQLAARLVEVAGMTAVR